MRLLKVRVVQGGEVGVVLSRRSARLYLTTLLIAAVLLIALLLGYR